jgi:ribosome maturation protein Sdo1
MDTASKGTMEDEFGTSREEDVVQQILEKGTIVESEVSSNTRQDGC